VGTARLEKVLIATHLQERDELLRRLQEEGILHISTFPTDSEEKNEVLTSSNSAELKRMLSRLSHATGFLSEYAGKRGGGMFSAKPSMPAAEFRRRVTELNLPQMLTLVTELSEQASVLDSEERKIRQDTEILEPWKSMRHPPSKYVESASTDSRFVFISSLEEGRNLRKAFSDFDVVVERISSEGETEYAVIIFSNQVTGEVEDVIKTNGVKMISLSRFTKTPRDELKELRKRLKGIEKQRTQITQKASRMADDISGLETALDLYENESLMREEYDKMAETSSAAFIEGWVASEERELLEEIVASFQASEVRSLKPRKGEKAPVALRNSSVIKPFEMIMNMYGTPDGREADPTPFMAPFFALFFALCLTDAGYGIVITLVTAYLIWIRKVKANLIWILFYGGVLTIVTGAATGSWFGNMPDFLQMPWLTNFRNAVLWFDPLKDPMPFFYLSLGVGFFQMLFGIGISVVDGLRTRQYGRALFESLPWFLIFLTAAFLAGVAMGVLPESFKGFPVVAGIIVIILSLGATIVLSERPGPTPVTSAILMWAAVTAAILALAKGIGFIPIRGIIIKGILVGIVTVLWLYTVYKGVTEKNLKVAGIIFGVLGLASVALHLAGMLGVFRSVAFFRGNLFLAIMFLINFVFALSVLKGWGGRIIWGTYNVYSNTTGVLGIVLSYVRLMALGMVTAGVAAAFNQIAWMFTGIPVVSVILILVVLVVGHVYNLVMSALSGFVHTLRLQYVEYLPQFFQGGGAPFEPFELKTRYVKVTRRK